MSHVSRPLLRYHGGKWRLAPWIIGHFPKHRIYVEPFGGSASVLLRKPHSYSEIYNDLDGEIVNLFRVLRQPAQARELVRLIRLTPYARTEFDETYIMASDPIEQARRTLLRSHAGFSTTGVTGRWRVGFRGNVTRTGAPPARNWQAFPPALEQIVERLQGIIIENGDAISIIERYDTPHTLHYLDPPYLPETRGDRWAGKAYAHEMTTADHRRLAEVLHQVQGKVIVSGYPCALYDDELFAGWFRVKRETRTDGARRRTEVLWMNFHPQVQARLPLEEMVE